MAKPTYAPIPTEPTPDQGRVSGWTPEPGMSISVVTFARETTCEAQFEHPAGWTVDQVQAAIVDQGLSIGPKLCWWGNPDETIGISAVALDSVLAGDESCRQPISLVGETGGAEVVPVPAPIDPMPSTD